MKRLKVMTVVGTRPEIIRLAAVMKRLDSTEAIEHIMVHTGQNYDYELNEVFFKDFGLRKPDYFLDAALGTPAETIGNILIRIDPLLEKERPDAFLVLGDYGGGKPLFRPARAGGDQQKDRGPCQRYQSDVQRYRS